MKPLKYLLALALLVSGATLSAQSRTLDALLAQDVRLAAVAERMLAANRALCRQHMPLTGLVLHSRDQYPDGSAAFGNGPIAVAAVVPGSPAAGLLAAGDGLAAIGATRTAGMTAQDGNPLRNTAFAALAEQPADAPLALTVLRGGQEQTVSLAVSPGCRALVEILAEDGLQAGSDGRVIQLNFGIAQAASDEALAVIFAHEMAHLVLEHRRRLEAAGISKGLLGEFGRNQQLNRQVEVEADRLSVHLLANAGYDPRIAPAFWRSSFGRRVSGGLLNISAVYPSAEARAQLIEREIVDYLGGGGAAPSWPGHLLARRDAPFD